MSANPAPFQPSPVPMYNPDDNTTRVVPPERIDEATAAGWEHAVKMVSPKGGSQWIPQSRLGEASKAGYVQFGPAKPQAPDMQKSNVGIALGSESESPQNPMQPGEQWAIQNPTAAAGAAGIGALGALPAAAEATPMAINAAAKAAIPHVVRLGQWAAENPKTAKLAIELLKSSAVGGTYAAMKKVLDLFDSKPKK